MKIKLFMFLGLLFIVLVGAYAFHINGAEFTLRTLTLPIAIWIILPTIVLFILAILHMSFYGFLNYLKNKGFYSDSQKFESFIIDLLLEKNSQPNFKTREFQNAAELAMNLKTKQGIANHDKFNEVIEILNEIDQGKNVNLKKYKLDSDNLLAKLNEKNLILSDINYAFSKIKNKKEPQDELDLIAFQKVLQLGTFKQIQTLAFRKNADEICALFERFEKGNLELNTQDFEHLLNEALLHTSQYISIAKISSKKLNPDSAIAIFKKLKEQNSEALKAYLYILVEFGMFDELRLELKTHKEGFDEFELILLARDHHKKIKPEQLIQ